MPIKLVAIRELIRAEHLFWHRLPTGALATTRRSLRSAARSGTPPSRATCRWPQRLSYGLDAGGSVNLTPQSPAHWPLSTGQSVLRRFVSFPRGETDPPVGTTRPPRVW